MKETEYIVATNNAKLSMVSHILHDILSGKNFGVPSKQLVTLTSLVQGLERSTSKLLDITEDE